MQDSSTRPDRQLRVLIADSIRIWGGAQRFIMETVDGLALRGHYVVIQTRPGSPLAVRAYAAGMNVMEVSTRADAAPWTVIPLAARYRRQRFDIVMTTFDKDLRTAGLAARLAASGTTVVHTRECDDPVKNNTRYRLFYTRVADHIVVNSESTRDTTLRSAPWLDADRVTIVYKGIELAPYESLDSAAWRKALAPDANDVVIGYAGQLIGRKRIDVLMRQLVRNELRSLPWRLAIAGTGPDEEKLRMLASELGIADRVSFSGFVEDIPNWFAAIDVFVLPSLIEGFGYVLAEAGAAAKPCVAYHASSVPEVVIDGETALLAEPGNDDELGNHIATLIRDAALRTRMGQAARADVFARHGLASMIDRIETLFLKLTAQQNPRGLGK